MKTIISFTCLCIMACNTAFAQNKIKAERIDFEYDASGSLVREVPYEETEELQHEGDSINIKNAWDAEDAPALFSIKKTKGEDVLKVFSSRFRTGTKVSLSVCSLSGVLQYTAEAEIEDIYFDLSTLHKGTYIITLTTNGEIQSKKYCKR